MSVYQMELAALYKKEADALRDYQLAVEGWTVHYRENREHYHRRYQLARRERADFEGVDITGGRKING